MKKKYYLIADIGNTFTKIALFKADKSIYKKYYIDNNKDLIKTLTEIFKEMKLEKDNIKECFIGSVNPSVGNELKHLVIDVLGIDFYEITNKTKFNFSFETKNIKDIGQDILGLCQYLANFSKDSVAFSFGTANLAILLKDKKLFGAIISGGLESSYHSLIKSASLIHHVNINKTSNTKIGHDTKSALEAGYFHHRNGFILSVLSYFKGLIDLNNSMILITGGSSLDEYENKKYVHEDNAVLLGYLNILIENKI